MSSPTPDGAAARPAVGPLLWRRPLLRVALYGWAVLGIALGAWVLWQVVTALALVVVPLVIALFPAAVLTPAVAWLQRRGWPDSLAALAALLGSVLVVAGLVWALTPSVAGQFDDFGQQVRQGLESVESFLMSGPFGLPPTDFEELLERAQQQLGSFTAGGGLGSGILGAVVAVTETVAGILFGLVALFFYLKDGLRIARWLQSLFPATLRDDAAEVASRAWDTLGLYIRGQLLIALIDAILIGIGIVVLGIPLALPLIVLIFIGGLFPLVGAVVAGAIAVLVALATGSFLDALILTGIIIGVQELEGDVLAPIILGKATDLHPLATLAALTAGAVLLGVLGAFIAIPVTASVTRAAKYLRDKRDGEGAVAAPA